MRWALKRRTRQMKVIILVDNLDAIAGTTTCDNSNLRGDQDLFFLRHFTK